MHTDTCMHAGTHKHTHAYTQAHMHACTHTHTHTQMHTHTLTHRHTHTHTHTFHAIAIHMILIHSYMVFSPLFSLLCAFQTLAHNRGGRQQVDGLSPESEHPQSHYTHRSSEQVNVLGGREERGGVGAWETGSLCKKKYRAVKCRFLITARLSCLGIAHQIKVIMFGDSTSDQSYHVWDRTSDQGYVWVENIWSGLSCLGIAHLIKVIMFGDSTSDQGYHVWG